MSGHKHSCTFALTYNRTAPDRSAKACVTATCLVWIILSSIVFFLITGKHFYGKHLISLQRDEGFQERVCTEPPCLSAAPEFYKQNQKKKKKNKVSLRYSLKPIWSLPLWIKGSILAPTSLFFSLYFFLEHSHNF